MCCGRDGNFDAPLRDMHAVRKVKPTRSDMTDLQREYFEKCVNLVFQMSMTIKSHSGHKIIQHDDDHQNKWDCVRQSAEECQNYLFDFAAKLVDSTAKFGEGDVSSNGRNGYDMTAVIRGMLMPENIAEDRVENGNWLRLVNVCRATIVYNCIRELYAILLILAKYNQNCGGFELIQIKDQGRFVPSRSAVKNTGWSNILVSVKPVQDGNKIVRERKVINLGCTEEEEKVLVGLKMDTDKLLNLPGHVCEIQLVHRAYWNDYQDAYNSFL